jgi:hypothetical protein
MSHENGGVNTKIAVKFRTAAEMTDSSENAIRNAVERGELRVVQLGSSRTRRVLVKDLYRWMGLDAETEEGQS